MFIGVVRLGELYGGRRLGFRIFIIARGGHQFRFKLVRFSTSIFAKIHTLDSVWGRTYSWPFGYLTPRSAGMSVAELERDKRWMQHALAAARDARERLE